MPKATKELAERLDYINAEMEKLRDNTDQESEWRFMELGQEHCDLISSYDWYDEKFEENGKKGLKNVKGEIVVPAIYDSFFMREPYFLKSKPVGAKLNGQAALVKRDGKGTPITEFEYLYIEPIIFTQLYAIWKKEDNKHFALMCNGKVITPYEIEDYGMACHGAVLHIVNSKKGLVLFEQYEPIYIKPEYDDIETFKEYAIVRKSGLRMQVDYNGKVLNAFILDDLNELTYTKQERITNKDGDVSYINREIPTDRFAYHVGGRCGLMDNNCQRLTEPLYANIEAINSNMFRATLPDYTSIVILNNKGQLIQ
jgi:hypothetical protein